MSKKSDDSNARTIIQNDLKYSIRNGFSDLAYNRFPSTVYVTAFYLNNTFDKRDPLLTVLQRRYVSYKFDTNGT